jgi:hypothetical protein
MMEAKHFTPEQMARFRERHQAAGQEGVDRWLREIGELAAEAGTYAERGTDPADPAVQELARRWAGAVSGMTGDDAAAISAIYRKIDVKGPEAATKGLVSAPSWDYLKRAFAVGFATPPPD